MADNIRSLEVWLKELEIELSKLPPGERELAMSEIQRVIRKPKSFVSSEFANTTERPVGGSAKTFFKWATIALVCLILLFFVSIVLIPLAIFKYAITVDGFDKDFSFTIRDQKPSINRLEGKLTSDNITNFTFNLSNGQVAVTADASATEVSYDCEIDGDQRVNQEQAAKIESGTASLSLMNVEQAECDVTVPTKIALNINVTNGQISLAQMSNQVEANLTNGEIEFEADDQAIFQVQPSVSVGSIDGLDDFNKTQKNKKGPQSYAAVLSVGNGRIDLR